MLVGTTGLEEGMACSVCGRVETDLLYYPARMDEEDREWIERIWKIDLDLFVVCEECMSGHCGLTGIPGMDADNWLANKIAEYRGKEKKD